MEHASAPGELNLPACTAQQFTYHVRMAAVFAVGGETAESASEAVLAWALLATAWPGAPAIADEVAAELVGQDQVALSHPHRQIAHTRAHGLALELESHFVSVGRREEAELYSTVADHLETTIGALVNHP